ncbi:MAG: glutathione S-transferase family protein [Alphaproteobacteria bacterium]|nr:glutathione S-transferase family protein [Alphaproteobacteria bacterium]
MKHLGVLAVLFGLAILPAASAQTPPTPASAPAASASSLTIYHLEGRRSERIVWLAEELGLPYNLVFTRGDLTASMNAIRAVNPGMPVAPTVTYEGKVLTESGAIIQYILDREGKGRLVPDLASPDYPAHLTWMHFSEGTLAADVIADYRTAQAKGGVRPTGPETDGQRAMRFADAFLATHPYFGGAEFSAADIMMWFPSDYADRIKVADIAKYPNLAAWQDRMEARPAFTRTLAVARPDGRVGSSPPLKEE